MTTSTKPPCPHCQSTAIVKNRHRPHQDGSQVQNYRCKTCGKQFNERIGTPCKHPCPLLCQDNPWVTTSRDGAAVNSQLGTTPLGVREENDPCDGDRVC